MWTYREQLERWQALLVNRLKEWNSPAEINWLEDQLTRVAHMIAYSPK